MKTLFCFVVLAVVGFVANFLWVFLSNLGGLPGALVGWPSPSRPAWRFWLGTAISFLGQTYVGFAYAAGVAAWTRLAAARPDVFGFLIWPVAFLVVALPIWISIGRAGVEARENQTPPNPQLEALHLTVLAVPLGFLIFAIFPRLAAVPWGWVPYVTAAARH